MKNIFKIQHNHLEVIIHIESENKLPAEEQQTIYEAIFQDKNILWHDDYTPYEYMMDVKTPNNKTIKDIKCYSTWGDVAGCEVRIKTEFYVKYE